MPVHVESVNDKAVAAKKIFVGRGLGGGGDEGDGDGFGASGFGESAFGAAGGTASRFGIYSVPFLCSCERCTRIAGGTYELPRVVS